MNKRFFKYGIKAYLAAGLLALAFSSTAMADFKKHKELKGYIALGVTGFKAEIKNIDLESIYPGLGSINLSEKFYAGTLRLGAPINNWLSLEGRLSIGKKKDYDEGYSIRINSVASGLLLIGPTQGKYRPYLVVGASRVEANLKSNTGISIKTNKIDPSYGIGLALYTRKPDVGLSFEYLHVADSKFEYKAHGLKHKQKTTVGALSITILKHF